MKKHVVILAAALLAVSAVVAFAATDALVGACIYKFDDTFMTGVRNAMRAEMEKQGGELEIVDSQNRQPMQNDQVDAYISKGANALIVNPVDRTAAQPLMEKAKAENLPIVFVNREPYAEVMAAYDKIWYVGAKAEESGTQSGQIIADYFKANPKADRNGDGKIQYIMIRGEQGHQDATLRTEYSTKAMKDAGFEIVELGNDTANWDKVQATDKMKGFISAVGIDNIEAVLANNDDMALGAIEALKAEGYNMGDPAKYIPVVGVDATAPALEAMKDGSMLGTVLNDADNQGYAAVRVAVLAADEKEVTEESIGYKITDGKYIWIPYRPVTVDNYQELMK
ncbi:MAG: galactose ABC transporter substrate-binding protein [Synergistaceae bacterium]|nr:galactose ABC transporter substrate-binding protein [Synergistaceae bacterium]